ncbi:MAG: SufE family protein, partial [Gammaproteobacteria bacterium]
MSSSPIKLTPSEDILAAQAEIVEVFSLFEDWTDRYQYIIDLGRKLPDLSSEQKIESNRLKGCQSQVWIVTKNREGR